MNKTLSKQLLGVIIFATLGLVALQISVSTLVGSGAKFTLFDMLAPVLGSFLGVIPGIAAVLITHVINTLMHGGFVDTASFIRPFPMLFALIYFARGRKDTLFIPLLAILAFNLHPVGRDVWYYSLFWFIPLAMHSLRDRFTFARALGATFTAHAVGGALWVWTFNLPATFWQGLIPVVIRERLFFALGITVVYIVMKKIIGYLSDLGYLGNLKKSTNGSV